MLLRRPSEERGPTKIGWLDSKHTFSFGSYYDSDHMGFGPLCVINEDKVAAGGGFGEHPHDNMEIVSYVLEGALIHKDSMGNGETIRPGDIQRMSAGTGVRHSEFNCSQKDPVHFLQIWFVPEKEDIEPSYEQKSVSENDKLGVLKLVMSRSGRDNTVSIHQDIDMYVGVLNENEDITFDCQEDRIQWIQIVRGAIDVNGVSLMQGDGLAVQKEDKLVMTKAKNVEIMLFDMSAANEKLNYMSKK